MSPSGPLACFCFQRTSRIFLLFTVAHRDAAPARQYDHLKWDCLLSVSHAHRQASIEADQASTVAPAVAIPRARVSTDVIFENILVDIITIIIVSPLELTSIDNSNLKYLQQTNAVLIH